MILLLDAHAVLWALGDPGALVHGTRRAIEDPANSVLVSAASIWELEIKRASDKVRFDVDLIAEIERATMTVLPITARDATDAARLALHHRDPFDRLLVAQARRVEGVLVTRDPVFARYDVEVLAA